MNASAAPASQRPRARISGQWLVIVLVGAAVLFGGLTWRQYQWDNPTSVRGELVLVDGVWQANATFAAEDLPRVLPGAGVILSSPAFPSHKMSGALVSVSPDGTATVAIQSGPPPDTQVTTAECVVTVDSATAP